MEEMYAFRYNPVRKRWVAVGSLPARGEITPAHLLESHRSGQFVAATLPRSPFLMEPPTGKPAHAELAYPERPLVGEYEVLLRRGGGSLREWDARIWQEWLELLQHRILMLHHNPHLHALRIEVVSELEGSFEGYVRAGEVIATSHPTEEVPTLTHDLARKLYEQEPLFRIYDDEYGFLQVSSAPTRQHELWYVPKGGGRGIEGAHGKRSEAVAKVLAYLGSRAYDGQHFVIQVHTGFAGADQEATWWLEAYQGGVPAVFRRAPELFVQQLLLGQ